MNEIQTATKNVRIQQWMSIIQDCKSNGLKAGNLFAEVNPSFTAVTPGGPIHQQLPTGTVASVLFEKNKVEKLNIGLIATICKSLFWHMYFEPGKNSFVYQPSLFRKITVYYSDCEWYSIGNVHLKLKTKERTIRVRIPDVMRIDVLVMMLVINGVEER